MATIKEIAEALAKVSPVEVSEMRKALENDIPLTSMPTFVETPDNRILSPKEYGMKLLNKRK